jgi:hypothetical protein
MIRIIRAALAILCLAPIASSAWSQSDLPQYGNPSRAVPGGVGVPAPAQKPTFGASNGTEILRHRGPTGSPCLAVGGFARPHVVNPNLYDHVIVATNNCPQRLAMRVCYYNTQDCISMEVPGNERKEAILGSLPSAKDFRFEFREKF